MTIWNLLHEVHQSHLDDRYTKFVVRGATRKGLVGPTWDEVTRPSDDERGNGGPTSYKEICCGMAGTTYYIDTSVIAWRPTSDARRGGE